MVGEGHFGIVARMMYIKTGTEMAVKVGVVLSPVLLVCVCRKFP